MNGLYGPITSLNRIENGFGLFTGTIGLNGLNGCFTSTTLPNFVRILGYRGELPDEVVELCTGCDLRSTHIWASIQAILKRNGLRRYYNRIGQIIWRIVRLKYSVWVNPNKLGFTLKRLIGC